MDSPAVAPPYGSDTYNLPSTAPSVATAYGMPDYSSPAHDGLAAQGADVGSNQQPDGEHKAEAEDFARYESDSEGEMQEPVVKWTGEMLIKIESQGLFGARRQWKQLPCYLYEGELFLG